jgi:transposase-like protein
MLLEQQDEYYSHWAAMNSIAAKVGCTAETLRKWVRQAEQDLGIRNGVTSDGCICPPHCRLARGSVNAH